MGRFVQDRSVSVVFLFNPLKLTRGRVKRESSMREENQSDQAVMEPLTHLESLSESWASLTVDERKEAFRSLSRADAAEFFLGLGAADQYELIQEMPLQEKRTWVRLLAPDDAADLVQQFPEDERVPILNLFDDRTRQEVTALLVYAEDEAGGLMNPRFIRL